MILVIAVVLFLILIRIIRIIIFTPLLIVILICLPMSLLVLFIFISIRLLFWHAIVVTKSMPCTVNARSSGSGERPRCENLCFALGSAVLNKA